MDLTATIAAACGVHAAPREPFDGMDLLPMLSGSAPVRERDLFWRINRPNQRVRAVRSGKWKFILDGSINNMYDLVPDPGETRDLYFVYPEVAVSLKAKLDAWEKSLATGSPVSA